MGEQAGKVVEGWRGPGRRDGVIEPLALQDDGLYSDIDKKGLYEWWYFDAHLESGHTIVIFFHASNPNPGRTGKIGIEFILISPEGCRKQEFFVYDKSEFEAAVDRPEVRIGRNTIKVDQAGNDLPVYEIYVDEGDLGCRSQIHAAGERVEARIWALPIWGFGLYGLGGPICAGFRGRDDYGWRANNPGQRNRLP